MSARLTVLLGAGGVGKTTLAAGYAIARARAGPGRVGLLGIDPSRRLQGALGVTLEDHATEVAGVPRLSAALLLPHASLRRWATEALPDPSARARLVANPFFLALADRLAAATDVIAAVRLAEWAEGDPDLAELVVDTAPGLNAIDFLRRPRQLAAFLEGPLVSWVRHVPRALARVGGVRLLGTFAEFLALIELPIGRVLERLAAARQWLERGTTQILLVTCVREDAAAAVRSMRDALVTVGLAPHAVILNRTLPASLVHALETVPPPVRAEAAALVRYARAYGAMQARVAREIATLAPRCIAIPGARGLGAAARSEGLAALGDLLRVALEERAAAGSGTARG